MQIKLYSDLHTEFEDINLRAGGADVVVLAGDIGVGLQGIEWLKRQKFNCPVIYVLGNHEYYGQRYPGLIAKMREAAGASVHVLENEAVDIDGVRFHGATMWTDFALFGDPRIAGYECQQGMMDFRKIRREPSYAKLRAVDVSAIHRRSLNWLSDSLCHSDRAVNVVVTHHAPSLESVPDHFKEDIFSAAFASNLEAFIRAHQPDFWLHGHMHSSSHYRIGSCSVLCNPRGYVGERNELFDPNFTFSLG